MTGHKRVLLTTSAAPSQSPFSTIEKRPPIGIGFLISVLRNAGHEVFFIDNYLEPCCFLETDYLQFNHIDLVGIYANTICYRDTLRMLYKLEYLRQTNKWKGKIVVGGPHTTVGLDTIPEFVDHVVQGEGEYALLDIVEGKATQRVIHYPRIQNLDELPMPAWDYFASLPYNWNVEWFPEEPVFTMNTSRGCPFTCTFCSVGSVWGKNYTYFSAERIVSDIEYLIEHHSAKGIYFREDNFTLNKNRLTQYCNLLLEKEIKIPWACETRVSSLDRETVELMSRGGVCGFYFGVESGSQRMLDFFKKGITVDQTRNAFALCHEYGIKTAASVVVGAPTETDEDLKQTLTLLDDIKPTTTWFNVFVGIPDSELYQYTIKNNLYEFIDDRGLVYINGHNERTKKYYGKHINAVIPVISSQDDRFAEPKISVVMSVYNGDKYLEKAIQSIMHQSFQDFEFIIIDDASTDSTTDILAKLTDPRCRIIRNDHNLGLTSSLNIGMREAKGEFIARMDADDISLPHRLEIQYEFLKKNPEYSLVGSSFYSIDENGKTLSLVPVLTSDQEIREGLQKQNWFGHGSVMMRKDAFLECVGYDEEFTYAQDYDLWLRISEKFPVANIEEPLYSWRITPECISINKEIEQQKFAQLARTKAQSRYFYSCKRPKVSVIIPTYNRPEMLADAIKSVLGQTYRNIEIIVINDCGIDVSNIIHELNTLNNIIYIQHDENKGLAAARNTGIRTASGKYITYLDDDDVYYPNHIEMLVNALEDSDYKIAYTDAYRAHQARSEDSYITINKDLPYSIDFSKDLLLVQNISPVNCIMHERNCLDKSGLFDEELTTHEDWDLWIRLSRYFDFIHIKAVTAEFRSRSDGSSMTDSMLSDFYKTMKIIYKRYHEHVQDEPHLLKTQRDNLEALKIRIEGTKFRHTCSIIIPVFNKLEFTKQCLEALIENTPDELYEVIIVDNASTDVTHEFLAYLEGDITVISNVTNLGFAKACNQGARAASGKYLIFLNNDTIPHPGWLTELVKVADEYEDIGIVGSKLLFPDGTIQHAGVVIVETPSGKLGNHLYWGYPGNFPPANRARDFQVVTAACMLIPGDLFFRAGGFDERYLNGMEDVDLCLKIRKSGKRVFYCPSSVLTHFESKTEGRFDRVNDNEKVFVQLWNDEIEADVSKYFIEDGFRIKQIHRKVSWVYHEELFNKLLSVIIYTQNSLMVIKRLIENIMSCTLMPVEIIVVDNDSTDGTKDYVRTLHNIHTVFLNEAASPAECFNVGLENAKGDFILFLNPEILLTMGWDTQFTLCFKKNTGAVSAIIYNYEDLMSFKDFMRNPVKGKIDLDYFASILAKWNKDKCEEKGILDPRCFMVKKDSIQKIGTFDGGRSKNTFDQDFSLRMKEEGYEVIRATGALVYAQVNSPPYVQQNSLCSEHTASISESIGIPLTSIIILTFNQIRFTKECLKSIGEHTNIPYELILVDNGSSDGTREYLSEFARAHKNVQLILNERNLGFAAGNNQGLERTRGDYILLLNNDVVVTEGWLERLISHLEQSLDTGMVGPMSNAVSGPQLVQIVPYGKDMKAMQRFARDFAARNSGKMTATIRLVGFCLLIRKEVIDIIGGLDEDYGSGNFEDDDLCLRAFIAGYGNVIAGDVFIHHYGSMTFKGNAINYQATMNDNRQYFADKWKDIIEISANGYKVHMTKEQQLKKLLEWGEERFSQGNIHSATKLFLRILQIDRTNSQALNNLGVIQWQHDDVVSAMETFQIALSFNPKDPDALANLLRAATESGKFDLLKPNLLDTLKQAQPANPDIAGLIDGHQGNVCINSRH